MSLPSVRRSDVSAELAPHSNIYARVLEYFYERLHMPRGGRPELPLLNVVERDEIDVRAYALRALRKKMRVLLRVVHAVYHCIFK